MRSLWLPVVAGVIAMSVSAHAASLWGTDVFTRPGGVIAKAPIGGSSTRVPALQSGGVLVPLTAHECKTLGGRVNTSSFCNSGKSCETTDQNGKSHEVCLSAPK